MLSTDSAPMGAAYPAKGWVVLFEKSTDGWSCGNHRARASGVNPHQRFSDDGEPMKLRKAKRQVPIFTIAKCGIESTDREDIRTSCEKRGAGTEHAADVEVLDPVIDRGDEGRSIPLRLA
jgi:hypothetical protein